MEMPAAIAFHVLTIAGKKAENLVTRRALAQNLVFDPSGARVDHWIIVWLTRIETHLLKQLEMLQISNTPPSI